MVAASVLFIFIIAYLNIFWPPVSSGQKCKTVAVAKVKLAKGPRTIKIVDDVKPRA